MRKSKCKCCGKSFSPSFRHPKQKYCLRKNCKKLRKAKYQREKLKTDPDYKANQKDANQYWLRNNPNYYKNYRKKNPKKAKRNAILQQVRNYKNRLRSKDNKSSTNSNNLIAKMELVKSPKGFHNQYVGRYWLISMIAKMESVKCCEDSHNKAFPQMIESFF